MNILNKLLGRNNFDDVRIEKISLRDKKYEKASGTVWFEPHNIEQCIRATKKLNIEHIHLQTYTLEFLNDNRLKDVKELLFNLKSMT